MTDLRRTPLYDNHLELGGKIVPFAGWEMPVQYPAGLVAEHNAVRNGVGIFDVSHMGELTVSGKDALAFLEHVTPNALSKIVDGQAQYSALTNSQGGIVDDIIIYRFSDENFFICVNASNTEAAFQWLTKCKDDLFSDKDLEIADRSDEYAQVAIQGPKAFALLEKLYGQDLSSTVNTFHFAELPLNGVNTIVARTGYTGEDGVEIFIAPEGAPKLWSDLLSLGESYGILPCGLGARDSLRLEVCYPLHGHELGEDISAIESGLGWIVKLKDKGDFIGRSVLEQHKNDGAPRSLVGFHVTGRGIVREEAIVQDLDGKNVGIVTSGTKTPTVGSEIGKALGLAIVDSEYKKIGTELQAIVRDKPVALEVVKKPFYKRNN